MRFFLNVPRRRWTLESWSATSAQILRDAPLVGVVPDEADLELRLGGRWTGVNRGAESTECEKELPGGGHGPCEWALGSLMGAGRRRMPGTGRPGTWICSTSELASESSSRSPSSDDDALPLAVGIEAAIE